MAPGDACELVLDCANGLGEAPAWDAAAGTLRWVDITGHGVWQLDPAAATATVRRLDGVVSAVIARRGGGLALTLADGVWICDTDDGPLRRLAPIEARDGVTRLNDAKVDPRGRLWVGSMAYDSRPGAGTLYRVGPGGTVDPALPRLTISNGMAWSRDETLMYFVDSATHGIDVLDFEAGSGLVTGRRRLVQIAPEDGLPDGLTIDVDGCLWVALWDGWQLRRYTPDGTLDRIVRLPVSRPTSCAFGGRDLADLYVTSARDGLADAQLADQPFAGGLFVVSPGTSGYPETPFEG